MNDQHTIRPGVGIGDLKFGASRAEARAYLGDAEEISTSEEEDGDTSIAWYYWSSSLSISFDSADDFRFGCVETSSPDARLGDVKPIGLSRADALLWLESANLGEVTEETSDLEDDGDGRSSLLACGEQLLNLWLEDGLVTEVQWGPLFDATDEVVWPS